MPKNSYRVWLTLSRWCMAATCAIAAGAIAFEATAQSASGIALEPAKEHAIRDKMGVNLTTNAIAASNVDISVGSGSFPSKLEFVRTYNIVGLPEIDILAGSIASHNVYGGLGNSNYHNLLAYFTCNVCHINPSGYKFINQMTLVVFGKSYHFTGQGTVGPENILIQEDDDGDSLTVLNPSQSQWNYQLITRDGLKIIFSEAVPYDQVGGSFAQYVEFPNGDFITLSYETSPIISGTNRLKTIQNSKGYGLTFSYTSGRVPTTVSDASLISSISAFHNTCATSFLVNCGTGQLATVTYGYNQVVPGFSPPPSGTNYLTSFTDALGNTTRYTYEYDGRLSGIIRPNNPLSPAIAIQYVTGVSDNVPTVNWISSVSFSEDTGFSFTPSGSGIFQYSSPLQISDAMGNVTKYNFSGPDGSARNVTITKPDGTNYSAYSDDDCYGPPCLPYPFLDYTPTRIIDELGQLTSYSHDLHGRPVSVTHPEGDSITAARDANGNITQVTISPKPNSGLSTKVKSFGYVPCNSGNYKYCNKPVYVIDANGNRTDFQYDTNSGEIAVELSPPDSGNFRRVTRYIYAPFSFASDPYIPPAVSPSQSYYLVYKDECLSSTVTGTTIDFSYICPIGNRRRDSYNYMASSSGSQISYELQNVILDSDHAAASTSYTYDVVGNITSITDARGNTSYVTYDALRRKVFEIGPSPGGGNPRLIVHHIYDADGNEVRTEYGTGLNIDGSDFSLLRHKLMSYDGNDRLIQVQEIVP